MSNPIKRFFEKKKAEAKFKLAGPGQKLGDSSSAERDAERRRLQAEAAIRARGPQAGGSGARNDAQQHAAEAALSR